MPRTLREGGQPCAAGHAAKLAGALSWAASWQFRKLGRAMLRPLFAHAHAERPTLPRPALSSLAWWLDVLQRGITETREWSPTDNRPPVLVFADARGEPPRTAAVIWIDGYWEYTDQEPPTWLTRPELSTASGRRRSARARRQFQTRSDNQIAGLEMIASALAVSTWEKELKGRKVRLFSDNTIAEWSFRKGSAKCCDHGAIVHHFWSVIGLLQINLQIERVPSGGGPRRLLSRSGPASRGAPDDNISDLPSREEYDLMRHLGATWRRPWLRPEFWDLQLPCQLAARPV